MCEGTPEQQRAFYAAMDKINDALEAGDKKALGKTVTDAFDAGLNCPYMIVELAEKRGEDIEDLATTLLAAVEGMDEATIRGPHTHQHAYA
jgi:hypothetical protein